jgi:hypothetical protein
MGLAYTVHPGAYSPWHYRTSKSFPQFFRRKTATFTTISIAPLAPKAIGILGSSRQKRQPHQLQHLGKFERWEQKYSIGQQDSHDSPTIYAQVEMVAPRQ